MEQKTTTTTTTTTTINDKIIKSKQRYMSLKPWITMISTLDGRDKFTKLLQYMSRLLVWYYSSSSYFSSSSSSFHHNNLNHHPNVIMADRFKKLKESLTTSRKAYRLGRSIIEWNKLYNHDFFPIVTAFWQFINRSTEILVKQSVPKSPPPATAAATTTTTTKATVSLFHTVGTAIKTIGLMGFWGADNIAYLATIGFLDSPNDGSSNSSSSSSSSSTNSNTVVDRKDHPHPLNEHSKQLSNKNHHHRLALPTKASIVANRCYFVAAIAGLFVNLHTYLEYQNQFKKKYNNNNNNGCENPTNTQNNSCIQHPIAVSTIVPSTNTKTNSNSDISTTTTDNSTNKDENDCEKYNIGSSSSSLQFAKNNDQQQKLQTDQHEQFDLKQLNLRLALLKSCCDVLVFSNNPGIDLWAKYYTLMITPKTNHTYNHQQQQQQQQQQQLRHPISVPPPKKMNEAFHCLCGIVSALIVLYQNFPSE